LAVIFLSLLPPAISIARARSASRKAVLPGESVAPSENL
jgi:hypothetical protein